MESADGQSATREFALEVLPAPGPVAIQTAVLPPGLEGYSYDAALIAGGGDGRNFHWEVVAGALPSGLVLSDSGRIEGIPGAPGTASFTARVVSAGVEAEQGYDLTVAVDRDGEYDIEVLPLTNIDASVGSHLEAAIAKWETVLTGDQEALSIPGDLFESDDCDGYGTAANGGAVDDILIIVRIDSIDGEGGALGQSGPCGIRSGTELPFVGLLSLDEADVGALVGTSTLTDLFTHEIAHVLGFGSLWYRFDLIAGSGTATPTFVGAGAVSEWHDLGGAGNVPLEGDGGVGTAEIHWEEMVFDAELMTAFREPVGQPQPMSRVTIASLADLGYAVDLGEADPFSLPSTLAAFGPVADGEGLHTTPIRMVRRLGPDAGSSLVALFGEGQ